MTIQFKTIPTGQTEQRKLRNIKKMYKLIYGEVK